MRYDEGREYDIIIDRLSHEVPFYRAMLKRAALEGTLVINNPFWWSLTTFFTFRWPGVGVAIPKTVLLPQKITFRASSARACAILNSSRLAGHH